MFVLKREIEDEFHHVLICPVLCNDHHHMWIKKLYQKFPSMYKLLVRELMSTNLTAATVCNKDFSIAHCLAIYVQITSKGINVDKFNSCYSL